MTERLTERKVLKREKGHCCSSQLHCRKGTKKKKGSMKERTQTRQQLLGYKKSNVSKCIPALGLVLLAAAVVVVPALLLLLFLAANPPRENKKKDFGAFGAEEEEEEAEGRLRIASSICAICLSLLSCALKRQWSNCDAVFSACLCKYVFVGYLYCANKV